MEEAGVGEPELRTEDRVLLVQEASGFLLQSNEEEPDPSDADLRRAGKMLDAETALREAQMRETVARYDVARQTYRLRYVTGRPVIDTVEELQ